MIKSAAGFAALGVGVLAFGGFAACSSAPEQRLVERSGEVAQALEQTVQTIGIVGTTSTLAGSTRGWLDSATPTLGKFNDPTSVAVAPDGNVYVADHNNNSIRVIKASDGSLAPSWGEGRIFSKIPAAKSRRWAG